MGMNTIKLQWKVNGCCANAEQMLHSIQSNQSLASALRGTARTSQQACAHAHPVCMGANASRRDFTPQSAICLLLHVQPLWDKDYAVKQPSYGVTDFVKRSQDMQVVSAAHTILPAAQ